MNLTASRRAQMPQSEFAGPDRSFPVSDSTHARLAISGATRSANAGNISQAQASSIKAKARAKLGDAEQIVLLKSGALRDWAEGKPWPYERLIGPSPDNPATKITPADLAAVPGARERLTASTGVGA